MPRQLLACLAALLASTVASLLAPPDAWAATARTSAPAAGPPSAGWQVTLGTYLSAPVVAGGAVFVRAVDDGPDPETEHDDTGAVVALDAATGAERWRAEVAFGTISSPVVAGDTVLIGGMDGAVYAFDAATGELLWTHALGGAIGASPAVADGVVYVPTADGTLVALADESRP